MIDVRSQLKVKLLKAIGIAKVDKMVIEDLQVEKEYTGASGARGLV